MGVVFYQPMDRIAGQSVLASERGNMAVFDPTESTLGGRPKRTVMIESKVIYTALA